MTKKVLQTNSGQTAGPEFIQDGLIMPVRKPIGWTSNDIIRLLKKRRRSLKIGHSGTLDPFADGLLLICAGKATKQVPRLLQLEKEYTARFELGIETDTLDITGRIVKTCSLKKLDPEVLRNVIARFQGAIEQVPPRFSALLVNGKRSYELAREGKELELKPRPVTIYRIEVLSVYDQSFDVRIVCSKGTYIRSLARDIAVALDQVGFVRLLTRTRIGSYTLDDAVTLEQALELIRDI
ncbi:MAG: tRNA pseudouridine(55) synthase TruB [candidate division KSB1 bacterium]|nr:tRNA pseudouridine(55) synthase TruB [candidate division KSB1 bacterium]